MTTLDESIRDTFGIPDDYPLPPLVPDETCPDPYAALIRIGERAAREALDRSYQEFPNVKVQPDRS